MSASLKTAIYDLSKMPTTFDFATWAVNARSHGCNHVHFIVTNGMAANKYSAATGWKRFGNILIPLCAIAGLDFSVGGNSTGAQFTYKTGDVCEFYKENGFIEKLKPTYRLDDSGYCTITLRESFRNKWRDSDIPEWQKFKAYLESHGKRVVMLGDCEIAPLDVEYRMALYAGAEMNYGVSNGPHVLCHLSDSPYITINMNPPNTTGKGYTIPAIMDWHKFPIGSQYNFRNDRQMLVYERDTFENILAAHEEMARKERIAA